MYSQKGVQTVGDRIKIARKLANLTQAELGEALGVSGAMIAQYENNLRNPKDETLKKLSSGLDVPMNFLKSVPPFHDLGRLTENKTAVLSALLDSGAFQLKDNIQSIDDISDNDYWWLCDSSGVIDTDLFLLERLQNTNDPIFFLKNEKLFDELLDKQKRRSAIPDDMVMSFSMLNEQGQQVAVERVKELTEIKRYQKDNG